MANENGTASQTDSIPAATAPRALIQSGSTALATPAGLFPTTFEGAYKLAQWLSSSPLVPDKMRDPSSLFLTILAGLDLGLSPVQAIRNIHIIDGKISTSADLKVALCIAQPTVCKYVKVVETTMQKATYETQRVGRDPERYTYTIEEAKVAGLLDRGNDPKKNNWNRFPAAMLRARCKAILVGMVYEDVLAGVTAHEETDASAENAIEATVGPSTWGPAQAMTQAPPMGSVGVVPGTVGPAPVEPPKAKRAKKEEPAAPAPIEAQATVTATAPPPPTATAQATLPGVPAPAQQEFAPPPDPAPFHAAAPQDAPGESDEQTVTYEQYRVKIDEAGSRTMLTTIGNSISMLAAQGKITSAHRGELLKQWQAKHKALPAPSDPSGGVIS